MKIALKDVEIHLPGGSRLFSLPHLEIAAGQKVLIEGASGKGKTTLLHLIGGLFFPDRGEVHIGEHRLNGMTDEQRCRFRRENIGIIFQKLNLIEHLTPLENVLLATGSDAEAKAIEALKSVGLSDRIKERSGVLSVGEQQRVAVARVLASNPQIILADEPTSSLDEANSTRVMELLFKAAGGKTLVVVSHDHRIENKFNTIMKFEDLIRA